MNKVKVHEDKLGKHYKVYQHGVYIGNIIQNEEGYFVDYVKSNYNTQYENRLWSLVDYIGELCSNSNQ